MKRIVSLFLAITAFASAQTRPQSVPSNKPDVILVTIDTLRADHVGCYGSKNVQTTTLDRLCSEGIKFENAFSASTITNTSHASIMTGLYPSRHGVTDFGVPLASSHFTIAEALKKSGYQTAAFIGAVILDNKTLALGFDKGFDSYASFPATTSSKERWGRLERRADDVVRLASAWLNTHLSGPRFAWVHLYDPHDPYEPPAPFAEQYKEHPYNGEIAYADSALGKLFALLQKQGRYDNALIIVMSDHGEGLGEHGEDTHGIFLYDTTTHIPLIVKLPHGSRKGTSIPMQVSSVDLLPTVLAYLKVPVPQKIDGQSFAAVLAGASSSDHVAFGETDYPLRFGWAPIKSVRSGAMKYIEAPRPEFYDLKSDPKEAENRYQPWDDHVRSLRDQLADFRKKAPASASAVGNSAPVDPNTVEELRALGYLGSNPGDTSLPEPSLLPDPKDRIAVQNLIHSGMMHDESGDTEAARAAFTKAVAADKESFVALGQLGQLEFKAGDFKSAAGHLAKAFALHPQDPTVAPNLGQALERTGDLKAARDVLESAVKLNAGQYSARVTLSRVYAAMGNAAAAQDQLEAAIFVDGKKPEARIELARLLLAQNKKSEAAGQLRKAQQADPNNPEIQTLLLKTN